MKIRKLIESQEELFHTGITAEAPFRLEKLRKLRSMIHNHQEQLCDAIFLDFGKPEFEAYSTEILTVLREIDYHIKNLSAWVKPVSVKGSMLTFPSRSRYYYQPYGTTLIIGPWNYPVRLLLHPLTGALSAGNTAILKPSELAPATSSLLSELIGTHFEPDYLTVVEGAADVAQELLSHPFGYIFFTGSTKAGKNVMKAAAEHLTPLTLELGGKSPAIIHHDANVPISARRVWWGKCMNSGQTCIAPDFVAVQKEVKDEFIEHSREILQTFYMDRSAGASPESRIINEHHFNRLSNLLEASTKIFGGETDPETRQIRPALIEADWGDLSMNEEIFGPVLPLILYDTIPELVKKLRKMASPLALYLFTGSRTVRDQLIRDLPFGGGCINDTITHFSNPELPIGGVGNSGMGSYQGRHSFETFSRKKSVLDKPVWPDPDFRYPPYTSRKLRLVRTFFS